MLSAPVPAASWVPSAVPVGAAWRRGTSASQKPGLGRTRSQEASVKGLAQDWGAGPTQASHTAEVEEAESQAGAWAVLSSCGGGGIQKGPELPAGQGHP